MSYLLASDMAWEEQTEKSRRKVLRLEDDLYVALVQWDAGFVLPVVDHHGDEEIVYFLDRTFTDDHRPDGCGPGTIVRGEPGSAHVPGTSDGVTFLVVRSLVPGEREYIDP